MNKQVLRLALPSILANITIPLVGLVDTCNRLGSQLDTARKTYDTAMNQLSDGTGNVLRRVEGLKELGVTSTKKVTTRRNQADALASIETTE